MKKGVAISLVLSLCVLLLISVGCIFVFKDNQNYFDKNITLESNELIHESFEIKKLDLHPGAEIEYRVNFYSKVDDKLNLSISFNEIKPGELKKYVNLEVEYKNNKATNSLEYYLTNDVTIDFSLDVSKDEKSTVYFRYMMPIDIGNEAQNTTADFEIVLDINRS